MTACEESGYPPKEKLTVIVMSTSVGFPLKR